MQTNALAVRAVASLVAGTISLLGVVFPLVGLPVAVIGLAMGITAEPSRRGIAQIGIALSALGLIANVAIVIVVAEFTRK
jgi:hypothetical protein